MSCRWRSSGEETGKGGANEADARQVWRFRRETAQTAEHKTQKTHRLRQMSGPEHTQETLQYVPESVFRCVCLPALPPSVSQQLYHAQALISASALIHTRMKDPGNVLVFLSEQFAVSHSHLGASWCCENTSSRHFHTFK